MLKTLGEGHLSRYESHDRVTHGSHWHCGPMKAVTEEGERIRIWLCLGEEIGLLYSQVHITVQHQKQWGEELRAGTWRQELLQRPWRRVYHPWLVQPPFSFIESRTTSPKMGLALSHKLLRKFSMGLPRVHYGGIFSVGVTSLQMTLGCVKLT